MSSVAQLRASLKLGWRPKNERINFPCDGEAPDLNLLESLPNLEGLAFDSCVLPASREDAIPPLPKMKFLCVVRCRFADGAIDALPAFPSLMYLSLGMTPIRDTDLCSIAEKYGDTVEVLNLTGTRIGDEGASCLPRFRRLRKVDLYHTNLTTDSVAHLSRCTKLIEIQLTLGGGLGEYEASKLRKVLPGVKIYWGS